MHKSQFFIIAICSINICLFCGCSDNTDTLDYKNYYENFLKENKKIFNINLKDLSDSQKICLVKSSYFIEKFKINMDDLEKNGFKNNNKIINLFNRKLKTYKKNYSNVKIFLRYSPKNILINIDINFIDNECSDISIVFLSDGSLWSIYEHSNSYFFNFPDGIYFEFIRGNLKTLLTFSKGKILGEEINWSDDGDVISREIHDKPIELEIRH